MMDKCEAIEFNILEYIEVYYRYDYSTLFEVIKEVIEDVLRIDWENQEILDTVRVYDG